MPIANARPDIDVPTGSLYELIFESLQPEDTERIAIIDSATGTQTTYGQLKAMVDAFAGALAHRGVQPHDVVALHCPNSLIFAVVFHGAMRAGATVTTIGSLATVEDIEKQLKVSQAKMVFTTTLLGPAGLQAAEKVGVEKENILDLTAAHGEATVFQALLAEGHQPPGVQVDGDTHIAVLPFSSGTTGVPKGVKLSHRNLGSNVVQMVPALDAVGLHRDSTVMGVLPFFHIYGMNVLLNLILTIRATLVTMPKFDLPQFLELHQKHNIDFSFVAPPIAVALAKHPIVDQYDLTSLNNVLSGAAPLDLELAEAVKKRLNVNVVQGFGMTETSPVTHCSVKGVTPMNSIGAPLANTEHKIVDLTDPNLAEIHQPTEEGERSAPGELWVRGPQIMVGYLNNEEATRNTLLEDGWLRTGDVAVFDSRGDVFVVDRAKELIKYKGYQVAPAELEALLLTREDISDSAVVGYFRREDGEEVPRAFVVAQEGHQPDAEEIMAWVAERVAPYKKIRMVEFIDAIPKSATGKILRKDLRVRPVT
ncbi:AMP-binding protein [Corynebacterium suicordis]